ncbi:MAG: HlyC/CorC family transporter [Candidatus Saganbacteria bacterium]|nr:HlyC/CorC family transporter [Candidatus Saganbacteria bacterium]
MIGIMILFALLFFSAFFSASETSLTAISKIRLARLVKEKRMGTKALGSLKKEPSRMLTTILIGNNIVNIWASVLAASLAFHYFGNIVGKGESFLVAGVTGVMTFVILVFGEIVPKTIALRNAEFVALLVSPAILVLGYIFAPIAWVLNLITRPLVNLFKGPGDKGFTEEEIKMVILAGERSGIIEEEEREMISSIFEFGDTVASEVMTPRPDIKAIEVNRSLADLFCLIKEVAHSRLPVYEGNIDNIVGVVYTKDLIAKKGAAIKDYLRQVLVVPESKKIDDIMRQMQSSRTHMAIIVDEYGTTSGIVTLEDLIEEIVGEIHDEFEKGSKRIDKIKENVWLVDAKLSINDLYDEINIRLPEGNYDTIAGFVFTRLGKMPSVGNSISFNEISISVEKLSRRRITRVKIEKRKSINEDMVGG